ncbi:hypothetical protein BH09ACT12_BH09ACT12_31160 [soil metagenome]
MSTSSAKPSYRTPLLAAVAGVVLLALVFAFAVGLPEADDEESAAAADPVVETLVDLPDSLPGDLVALTSPEMPDDLVEQTGGAEKIAEITASAAENVADIFGGPADFGLYGKVDGSALLTVTVAPGEPGLFVPDGAPVSADVQGVERSDLEIVRVGDAVCSVLYTQAVASGQTVDPDEQPARVHCQLGSSGLLYDVTGQGLSVESTVAAGEAVLQNQADSKS